MRDANKQRQNELKFGTWEELDHGGRRYSYTVKGKVIGSARYVKEVDADENATAFYQEIFDAFGNLVEIHRKFPVDEGHRKI
ncbi:MAG: hypothetical protein WBW71_03570 [Bacteroidota bacterium]